MNALSSIFLRRGASLVIESMSLRVRGVRASVLRFAGLGFIEGLGYKACCAFLRLGGLGSQAYEWRRKDRTVNSTIQLAD